VDVENFSRKLWNRYSDNSSYEPTPCQTQTIISQNQFLNKLSELTGIEDIYKLGNVFCQKKGKNLTDKDKELFIECLTKLKENEPNEFLNYKSMNKKYFNQILGEINASRIAKLIKKSKKK